MLEIDVSLFITGDNDSIYIGIFYERLLNVGTFEILDPSFNANVKAAVIIDTVSAYGESDYSIKNNTSVFTKLKFYKPPVLYQPNEKYILDFQQNFINIDGEPRLIQANFSIQIPTYITMDYPKSLKIMTAPDFDPSFNYMTGSYYMTPHLTAMPAYTNTGFYGTFTIGNQKAEASDPRYIEIKLEYNNINIVTQIINSETTEVLTIPIGSRLPLPSSILQLKTRIEGPPGISGVEITNVSGWTMTDITGNDPTDENILSLLVDSAFIDGGNLTLDFIIDTQ